MIHRCSISIYKCTKYLLSRKTSILPFFIIIFSNSFICTVIFQMDTASYHCRSPFECHFQEPIKLPHLQMSSPNTHLIFIRKVLYSKLNASWYPGIITFSSAINPLSTNTKKISDKFQLLIWWPISAAFYACEWKVVVAYGILNHKNVNWES